jgi:hypothetical protein
MTYRVPRLLTMVVVMAVLVSVSVAKAQENFRLLGEKEIKARVIGNDITDPSHWSMYFRSDGALIRDETETSRKWTGMWKIQKNKLCISNPSNKLLNCHEVWMSGQNIRLRVHEDEETFDAVVEKHKAN